MTTIEQKLDLLAEFHAQRDLLELDKKRLLDDVKIPDEIQAIVSSGMKAAQSAEEHIRAATHILNSQIENEAAAVKVPAEVKAQLDALDAQRAEIMATVKEVEAQRQAILSKKRDNENAMSKAIADRRAEIQAEVEAQTREVYNQVAQRKAEIEAEFSGKAEDVTANIAKLEAEIKDDMKRQAAEKLKVDPKAKDLSAKGKYFHAVYVRGRVTWNTDKMDAWCNDHPFLREARKEGDPSITLRKI